MATTTSGGSTISYVNDEGNQVTVVVTTLGDRVPVEENVEAPQVVEAEPLPDAVEPESLPVPEAEVEAVPVSEVAETVTPPTAPEASA